MGAWRGQGKFRQMELKLVWVQDAVKKGQEELKTVKEGERGWAEIPEHFDGNQRQVPVDSAL